VWHIGAIKNAKKKLVLGGYETMVQNQVGYQSILSHHQQYPHRNLSPSSHFNENHSLENHPMNKK